MSETAEAVRKLSAALLARGTGLGSQEINWLLHRAGLLEGEPGAWRATEKALPYVAEEFRQRGTGGYAFMNPSWEWLTWDPAVLDELDLSDAGKQWARQVVKDRRLAQQAELKVARATADAEFLARQAKQAADAAPDVAGGGARTWVLVGLGAAAAAATGYGLYKVWRRRQAGGDRGVPPEGGE
jgi:hypothetical protein